MPNDNAPLTATFSSPLFDPHVYADGDLSLVRGRYPRRWVYDPTWSPAFTDFSDIVLS